MNPPTPPPFEPAMVTDAGSASGGGSTAPTFGSMRTQSQPGPASNGTAVQSSPSARSLVADLPDGHRAGDRDLAGGRHLQVDACEADRAGDRDRAAADLGRQRDDDALVVAIDASLAAGDAMQPAVAVDEVGMHGDAGPVARHRAGVGRVRCRGERGVERDLETPGCAGDVDRGGRRSSGGQGGQGRRDRLAGLVRREASGSARRASGSIETIAPLVTTRPTSIDSRTALVTPVTPSTEAMAGSTAQPGVVG